MSAGQLSFAHQKSAAYNSGPYPYMLIERTELRPADAILIFGNANIVEPSAAAAVRLFKQGMAPLIIAAGGVETNTGETEAHALARAIVQHKTGAKLIIEPRSRNTQENIEYARADLGGHPVRSVIGIGHICAGRRFLMTLARRWPEVTPMFVGINPYDTHPSAWNTHYDFKMRAQLEFDKIPRYKELGFVTEIDLDDLNRRIRLLPANGVKIPAMERAFQ